MYYSLRGLKVGVLFIYLLLFIGCLVIFSKSSNDSLFFIGYYVIFALSLYTFKAFDEATVKSISQLIVSFLYATISASIIMLAAFSLIEESYTHNLIFSFVFVSLILLPLIQFIFFNFFLARMPRKKCVVFGNKKEWADIVGQLAKNAVIPFEVLTYYDGFVEKEELKELSQINFIINALSSKTSNNLKAHSIYYERFKPVISIAKLYENSSKSIPVFLFKRFEQYYSLFFSEVYPSRLVRTLDVTISIIVLLVLSPVLLVSMLLIFIFDGKNVFFTQERYGFLGKRFKIYKLNTMKEIDGEVRSTKLGHWLRKFRFNEIPQILNIIKGDMSLVGPRPDLIGTYEYCMENIPYYRYRFNVLPGLTGHAQVSYKYIDILDTETFSKRLSYDLFYVKNISPYYYLTILLRTIESVLMRRGA